jgi:predicted TIM-barrel fold metal-dependent hydrolase
MYNDEIIDTHMHLWDLKNNYHWLNSNVPDFEKLIGNYDSLRHNFLPDDYHALVKNHKIVQSVHVQAFGFPDDPVAETQWLQDQANRYGFPHGIVAFANLAEADVGEILEQHARFPGVRGIRMPLNYHVTPYRRMADRGDYMADKQWRKGFALLADYDFSFDVQIYDHQIQDVTNLAEAFPHIKMIIEHFAWPTDLSAHGFALWKKRVASLVKFPNIYMKLSGIGCVFQHLEAQRISDYIDTALKLLGVDRCMFGSNCPPDTLFYTFDNLMTFYKKALLNFSTADQYKFFYLNAKKNYRL